MTSTVDLVFNYLDGQASPTIADLIAHGQLQGWPVNTCTTYFQRWKKHKGKVRQRQLMAATPAKLITDAQNANAAARVALGAALAALDNSTAALALLLQRQAAEAVQTAPAATVETSAVEQMHAKNRAELSAQQERAKIYQTRAAYEAADPDDYAKYKWHVMVGNFPDIFAS